MYRAIGSSGEVNSRNITGREQQNGAVPTVEHSSRALFFIETYELVRAYPSAWTGLISVPSEFAIAAAGGRYTPAMRILSVIVLLVGSLFGQSVAGVKWTAPARWKSEAARPMRAATYTIAPADGDAAGAECAVYFFGPGQGGSVEANLDRWKGQMVSADGKPPAAKIAKRTIHQLSVTTIDASGDYTGMGGPMAVSRMVQKNYRLLGAIIEGVGGNVFVKLTGPAKTVAVRQAEFEQLLNSFEREK